eukprot:6350348-Amphidinium_carterae.2
MPLSGSVRLAPFAYKLRMCSRPASYGARSTHHLEHARTEHSLESMILFVESSKVVTTFIVGMPLSGNVLSIFVSWKNNTRPS